MKDRIEREMKPQTVAEADSVVSDILPELAIVKVQKAKVAL
jgi:hypothetical protein